RAAPLQDQGDAVERRSLQFAVALQERLDELSGLIFGRARRGRFDIDGWGLAFRRQRRGASRSISGRHATTIACSGFCALGFGRVTRIDDRLIRGASVLT